jgi:sugar phosphate isomerase/epimerase
MKRNQLGIQLYTVRDYCKTAAELADSLTKLVKIGYRIVEPAGTGKMSIKEFRSICEDRGFTICSVHDDPNNVLNEPDKVADRAREFGCDLVAYAYPAGIDLSRGDSVRLFAQKLEKSAKRLKEQGIQLVYHNHAIEFSRVENKSVLELIYETAPSLGAELDICWVQAGGGSPVDWCNRMKGRFPIVHLKDYGHVLETGRSEPLEIGAGNLDFKAILQAATDAGCQWFVVEDDNCRPGIFESVGRSFGYLSALAR